MCMIVSLDNSPSGKTRDQGHMRDGGGCNGRHINTGHVVLLLICEPHYSDVFGSYFRTLHIVCKARAHGIVALTIIFL